MMSRAQGAGLESGGPAETAQPEEPFRVLIVDDHPMIRRIVALACEDHPALEVAGEAANGAEALDKFRLLAPDVTVLDLMMPGVGGLEVARVLLEERPGARILVLSAKQDERSVFECLSAGALGFVEKTASIESVARAIDAVGRGRQVLSDGLRRAAFGQLREAARNARHASDAVGALTPRERGVLALIAEGLTARQMARRLGVSERTIETHIANLYRKLDVRSRVQAVNRAAALRLVEIG
ncbi:MAG: response regulator transcription factor [Acidobacteria bacterium]|nr:response regulator transcription factor [Acidobacteriota bacterium]